MIPGDDMTEERWQNEAAAIAGGWAPARVPVAGTDDDGAFGWRKGSFFVFEGADQTQVGRLELSSLTHVKTGMRIALFADPHSATAAADLAERVGDWSELDDRGLVAAPGWEPRIKRMYTLWQEAGFFYGPIVSASAGKAVWCALERTDKESFS